MITAMSRISALAISAVLFVSCGSGGKISAVSNCADYLPAAMDSLGMEKSSETRVFSGESLSKYIDGGAEIYHTYNFVEVATADYRAGNVEMTADVYGFDNSEDAYGLYANFRPDGALDAKLGAESFETSNSVDLVKGPYVVRVIAFEDSETALEAVLTLASQIDSLIPGGDSPPSRFLLFPADSAIAATGMYYPGRFLGFDFLAGVYTLKYSLTSDTLILFLTEDSDGGKFSQWFERGSIDGAAEPGPADLPYDEGRVFITDTARHGKIIAGLKGEMLAGMIGYDHTRAWFLSDWLLTLR